MTSSLEGEGEGSAKRWKVMTWWHGGVGGGVQDWWQITIFYRHFRQDPNYFKYISGVISNLNIEQLSQTNIHQRPGLRCFVADQFVPPFTLTKGGGSRKMTWWQGGGGGLDTPQKWWRHLWTAPYCLIPPTQFMIITATIITLITTSPSTSFLTIQMTMTSIHISKLPN